MQAPSHTADAPPQERPGFGFVISKYPLCSEVARMMRGMRENRRGFAFA
jgi:hypothetical protein